MSLPLNWILVVLLAILFYGPALFVWFGNRRKRRDRRMTENGASPARYAYAVCCHPDYGAMTPGHAVAFRFVVFNAGTEVVQCPETLSGHIRFEGNPFERDCGLKARFNNISQGDCGELVIQQLLSERDTERIRQARETVGDSVGPGSPRFDFSEVRIQISVGSQVGWLRFNSVPVTPSIRKQFRLKSDAGPYHRDDKTYTAGNVVDLTHDEVLDLVNKLEQAGVPRR